MALATGDLDRDGHEDIAQVGGSGLCVQLGAGDGSFAAPSTVTSDLFRPVVVDDLDGDGAPGSVSRSGNAANIRPRRRSVSSSLAVFGWARSSAVSRPSIPQT